MNAEYRILNESADSSDYSVELGSDSYSESGLTDDEELYRIFSKKV